MKVQISTEYAIKILQYMHETSGRLWTAMDIAKGAGITYPFFIKIANTLKKGGLISSVQGRNGGYRLKKKAHEITIYDVFLCIEGELKISHCLQIGQPCAEEDKHDCYANQFFCKLKNTLILQMTEQTIASLSKAG